MELIKITERNGNSAVSARELYQFLESKQQFSDWIQNRIRDYGFIEGQDFEVFHNSMKNPNGGRPTVEYAITLDMAKELSMVERNEKGKQARMYFIECEKKLRETNPLFYAIEVSSERITEKRQILHKHFVAQLRKYFYRGDLKEVAKENKFSYNRVIRVMNGTCFDNNIIDVLHEKAMNNKYALECKMEVMITELSA
ncbi:antA/AntB antirepressor family protein [Riemerella anatipestifer]|uniref:antA/AntB antirepressor family protein n=1 Tax=Riemerella anatipestifer TaxID=34085 RepID=UPI00069BB3A7|nr:antA/AntB antirepressor family protein [Riemerella anatipestifer]